MWVDKKVKSFKLAQSLWFESQERLQACWKILLYKKTPHPGVLRNKLHGWCSVVDLGTETFSSLRLDLLRLWFRGVGFVPRFDFRCSISFSCILYNSHIAETSRRCCSCCSVTGDVSDVDVQWINRWALSRVPTRLWRLVIGHPFQDNGPYYIIGNTCKLYSNLIHSVSKANLKIWVCTITYAQHWRQLPSLDSKTTNQNQYSGELDGRTSNL